MKYLVAIFFVAFLLTISSTQLLWVFFYYSNKKSGTFSEAKIGMSEIYTPWKWSKKAFKCNSTISKTEVVQERIENVKWDLCENEFHFKHGNVLQSKKV